MLTKAIIAGYLQEYYSSSASFFKRFFRVVAGWFGVAGNPLIDQIHILLAAERTIWQKIKEVITGKAPQSVENTELSIDNQIAIVKAMGQLSQAPFGEELEFNQCSAHYQSFASLYHQSSLNAIMEQARKLAPGCLGDALGVFNDLYPSDEFFRDEAYGGQRYMILRHLMDFIECVNEFDLEILNNCREAATQKMVAVGFAAIRYYIKNINNFNDIEPLTHGPKFTEMIIEVMYQKPDILKNRVDSIDDAFIRKIIEVVPRDNNSYKDFLSVHNGIARKHSPSAY